MFSPPAGYVPTMVNPLLDHSYTDFNQLEGINRLVTCCLFCIRNFLVLEFLAFRYLNIQFKMFGL